LEDGVVLPLRAGGDLGCQLPGEAVIPGDRPQRGSRIHVVVTGLGGSERGHDHRGRVAAPGSRQDRRAEPGQGTEYRPHAPACFEEAEQIRDGRQRIGAEQGQRLKDVAVRVVQPVAQWLRCQPR
jgi:hypothetical protein